MQNWNRETKEIILKIDGAESDSQEIQLPAGGNQPVIFKINENITGEHTIDINGQGGQFSVIAPQPKVPEVTPEPDSTIVEVAVPNNLWII